MDRYDGIPQEPASPGDGRLREKLASPGDGRLRALTYEIGAALGIGKQETEALAGGIGLVGKAVEKLSREDIERLRERLGADRAARICEVLSGSKDEWK